MNDEIEAVFVSSIEAASLADENEIALFRCRQEDGTEFNIAIPEDQVTNLILVATQLSGRLRRASPESNLKFVYPLEWWEVSEDAGDPNSAILSFRMEGGAEMSYRMRKDVVPQYVEVLQTLLGQSPSPAPGGSKH